LQETLVNAGPTQSGKVISQSPSGGQQSKGSTIALSIGQ
jgi:beta-lactam-binding protein with PASTA domain